MKFSVKRKALLSELNLARQIVDEKSTIPILSNVLLEAKQRLNITATDLDVSICCGCDAQVETEGTVTLSARRLYDIVRFLPDDAEIRFTLLDNDWVELRSGNSEYKVVSLPKENFPEIPKLTGPTVAIAGNLLKSMIQRTMFAITQEESYYPLNGALLILNPQEIRMVATDGHRLALVASTADFPGLGSEIRALIPCKTLVEVQKLIGDQELWIDFGRDENHLFFSVGARKLVSRILAGQFPNYEMVIPRDNDKTIVASTRALSDGIRRVVAADKKLKAIRLSVSSGSIELTAGSAEAGEGREVVPVEYEGKGIEIRFNPQYLLDFLGVCGSEAVSLEVKDSETQGMLRPTESGALDYRYIVMPMKF